MDEKKLEEKSYVGCYKGFHIWRETYIEGELFRTESYCYEDDNGNGRSINSFEKLIRHLDALEARAAGRVPEIAGPGDHLPHGEDPGDTLVLTPGRIERSLADFERRLSQLRQDLGGHTDRIYGLETKVNGLEKRS